MSKAPGHKHGTHLGGVRSIEDIRLRCVISECTGCWHLRSAYGRPLPKSSRQVIWVHGRGAMSVPRVVWELSRLKAMPKSYRAFRTCQSYDCANPEHIMAGNGDAFGKALRKRGVFKGDALRILNARAASEKRRKLSPEERAAIVRSNKTNAQLARDYGVGDSIISRIRRRARELTMQAAPSVFHWGEAMNVRREAA